MDPPRGACLLGDKITPSGQETSLDRCTECKCTNSTVLCKREICPPLDCPVEKQTYSSHNQCCPQCPRTWDKIETCKDNGKIYVVSCLIRIFLNFKNVPFTVLIIDPIHFYRTETPGKWTSVSRAFASTV